jgi:hypothetical protein
MLVRRFRALTLAAALITVAGGVASAQTKAPAVTTPKQFFGFNIGDDYNLATYDQFTQYWQKIDKESARMQVIEIGKTEEGRPHLAAIVTAPENFAKLDRYKQIAQQLHRARGISEEQARALAKEGKAVVWIDGGLHATEVVGAHQLVSRTDDETARILRDVIVIAAHANPDGMQMVSKCYMQNADPLQRRTCSPRLYEKYAGHDNNRDFYMSNTKESQNLNKLMYWEWLPQIMYNHHQSGPVGTVIFTPPFRDPFNYNFDPMIVTGLDMVGAAMHHRFLQEGKPGFTMRSGSSYSTWWNGGLRTTAYFQNIIGLLTEIIGNPTPSQIPPTANQILPRADLPAPIEPQVWHFRQSIDYSVTANYAVLDLASRYKDQFLYNIYKMGANQIERGSRDHWTISNEDMARLQTAMAGPAAAPAAGAAPGGRGGRGGGAPGNAAAPAAADAGPGGGGRGGRGGLAMATYNSVLKDPARRDPRVYIIPADQADSPTATKFINTLRYIGIEIHQATAPLTVNGKTYPAGSYVVKTAQAGRAHVIDMFEPQDHPNDMDERGIPRRPYDNAGWTLSYQMGVKVDRIWDDVTGPLQGVEGLASPIPGRIGTATATAGYLLSPSINDSFTIANRVMKANGEVSRLGAPMTANGKTYPAGALYIAASAISTPIVQKGVQELGVNIDATGAAPAGATRLAPRRIALWDTATGSMPSGWTRFLFERFEFPFTVVCGAGFDDTALRSKYDVIVMPSGAAFRPGGGGGRGGGGGGGGDAEPAAAAGAGGQSADPDLRSLCQVTTGTGTGATAEANVKKFVESGGTVIAAGSSARSIADLLDLPVSDYLVERQPGQQERGLSGDKFYVPGSVLRVAVDTAAPSAAGAEDHIDVFFNNSPVFRLEPNATARGVRPVMWFDSNTPLRSGWAWGQNYLEGGTTAFEASVGQGKVYAFGPEITFRAQPHGTFKFLFNGIYLAGQTTTGRAGTGEAAR